MWVQLSIADHARKRIRAARVLCQVIALVVMVPSLTRAQGRFVDREPQIKAVYVYKFIAYTQWPAGSFVSKDAALVIGTVGDDPVNKYLKLITQKRKGGEP